MEFKDKLKEILVNISIIQPEIDSSKNSATTQSQRLKLGALISRIMAYEVEFHTLYDLAKEQGEELEQEFETFYNSIKLKSSVGLVNVVDGKVVFQNELKKILEDGN